MDLDWISRDEDDTLALGRLVGQCLQPGDVLALVGPLGAGKTRLTQGIAKGLGIEEPVTSPTFILVAEYRTRAGFPLYHADCYRLDRPLAEAQDIGLDELLDGRGACVVEWAERVQPLLPPDTLLVRITPMEGTQRRLNFHAHGARATQLLRQIATLLESAIHVASRTTVDDHGR